MSQLCIAFDQFIESGTYHPPSVLPTGAKVHPGQGLIPDHNELLGRDMSTRGGGTSRGQAGQGSARLNILPSQTWSRMIIDPGFALLGRNKAMQLRKGQVTARQGLPLNGHGGRLSACCMQLLCFLMTRIWQWRRRRREERKDGLVT